MRTLLIWCGIASSSSGCGDDRLRCGPGTTERGGVCVAASAPSASGPSASDEPGRNPAAPAELAAVRIIGATASSERGGHPASHAVDGDLATAWNSSAPAGTGQWIELRLAAPARVRQVELWPGYWGVSQRTGESLFTANARPSRITITVGTTTIQKDVPDLEAPVVIDMEGAGEPAPTDTVRISIDAVHEGTRYHDVCVTEMVVRADANDVPHSAVASSPPVGASRLAPGEPSEEPAGTPAGQPSPEACHDAEEIWSGLSDLRGVQTYTRAGQPGARINVPQVTVVISALHGQVTQEQLLGAVALRLLCRNPAATTAYLSLDTDGDGVDDVGPTAHLSRASLAAGAAGAGQDDPEGIHVACRLASNAWNGLAGYQGVRLTHDARGPSAVVSRQIGTVFWAGNSPDISMARDIATLQRTIGFHLFCENPGATTAYIGLDDDLDWAADSTLTMARPDVLQGSL